MKNKIIVYIENLIWSIKWWIVRYLITKWFKSSVKKRDGFDIWDYGFYDKNYEEYRTKFK